MTHSVTVVGGGFAGTEAAWQAAEKGAQVLLYEMRPQKSTPAHKTGDLAELVCSNSLKADSISTASGLLKAELRSLGSLVLRVADTSRVPAGQALAVDRKAFASEITRLIESHPRIRLIREEVRSIPSSNPVIIATGPLTTPYLAKSLTRVTGENHLYFYDAISPIVDGETINYDAAFFASRYGKGETDSYLNLGLSKTVYAEFCQNLIEAEKVPLHAFEETKYFEGCLPIEVLAERGEKTMAYGPLKPVGLNNPKNGSRFHAVVQLRRENTAGTAYNMVGFQTKMTYSEQRRVFRNLPGLEQAAFFRYGSIHRNTYLNAPRLLLPTLQLRKDPRLFIAGQITGVEGYLESTATGLIAGLSASAHSTGNLLPTPPSSTAIGSLLAYLKDADPNHFQPININYGILPRVTEKISKEDRRRKIANNALQALEQWKKNLSPV